MQEAVGGGECTASANGVCFWNGHAILHNAEAMPALWSLPLPYRRQDPAGDRLAEELVRRGLPVVVVASGEVEVGGEQGVGVDHFDVLLFHHLGGKCVEPE